MKMAASPAVVGRVEEAWAEVERVVAAAALAVVAAL